VSSASYRLKAIGGTNDGSIPAPVRPASFPAESGGGMDEDIPPEIFDQIRESELAFGGGVSSNIRVCQYCTFENTHNGTDCEVCGLPL
jgi:nuclear protein localization protein 4 homolog